MIQTHTVRLKLADDAPKSLGVSHLITEPVICAQGLVEDSDFAIDRERGTIRRLREFGRELYTFTMRYDDRSETRISEEAARTDDRAQALAAIANLQAYRDLAGPTNAQTVAVVKLLAAVAIILIRRAL